MAEKKINQCNFSFHFYSESLFKQFIFDVN